MASFYPNRVKPGTSEAERKLYAALQGLCDDWTVIHSVAWQANRAGKAPDCEAQA